MKLIQRLKRGQCKLDILLDTNGQQKPELLIKEEFNIILISQFASEGSIYSNPLFANLSKELSPISFKEPTSNLRSFAEPFQTSLSNMILHNFFLTITVIAMLLLPMQCLSNCATLNTITKHILQQDNSSTLQSFETCDFCNADSFSYVDQTVTDTTGMNTDILHCEPCDSSCLTCYENSTNCLSCDPSYTLNDNQCTINCSASYGTGCSTCDTTVCLSCITAYAFPTASPTTCTACSTLANCVACRDGLVLVCEVCSAGLVTDTSTSNGTCVTCSLANCVECKNGPECVNCAINYVLNGNGRLNGCTTCPAGSYASSSSKCSPCPTECSSCSYTANGITCASCNPFAIHSATTQQCINCKFFMDHCLQCSSSTVCTSCQYPYKLGSSQMCDQCQSGFFYSDGFCTKEAGCQIYLPSQSKCLSCAVPKNLQLDNTTKKCACKNGHYPSKTLGLGECVSKCGDGILVPPQEYCDDGNVINGDGCSDNCQQQNGFVCLPVQPSQCLLQYTPTNLEYNYAYRYEGENKGRFSLSLEPYHPALKQVNWAKYFFINVSQDFIANNSKVFAYVEQTNELTIDFEYKRTVEEITVEFRLVLDSVIQLSGYRSRLLLFNDKNETIKTKRLLAPSQMKITVKLSGINSKLVYQEETLLQVYKAASIGSYIVTVLIMVQFVLGSYTHKMIGLETIQILQFFFFVRIILQQRLSTFLNAMNVFKYAAYGGYSNNQLIYGQQAQQIQALTYKSVQDKFVTIELMKYFTLNANLALVIPALILIVFFIYMARKNAKRGQYLENAELSTKDEYTILRRSFQWVYDHFVFPYINIFNMIAVFSTVLYLQARATAAKSSSSSSLIQLIETTSFGTHLAVAFITFSIYCFEMFQSYEEFKHSRLTEAAKARVPKSIYEKLEHDENNPDRPNYKPGYILFYLVFYFFVELVLMLDVLFVQLGNFGVEIMLVLTFVYLVFVWKWQPYNEAVDFHNKALRFNHFTVVFFMAFSSLSKRVQFPSITYAIVTCLVLAMLTGVGVIGYIRIAIELKFRKKLLDDPTLMNARNPGPQVQIDEKLTKKQALLRNNPFAFENQVKAWLMQKQKINVNNLSKQQIDSVKDEIQKEIYEYKRFQQMNDFKEILNNDLCGEKDKRRTSNKKVKASIGEKSAINESRQVKF